MRIAAIGPPGSVLGFKALGVEVFEVERPGEAREVWGTLKADRYAVIFVTEDLLEALADLIETYGSRTYPVVTSIPTVSGSGGAAVARLKALVEKAVGSDMALGD